MTNYALFPSVSYFVQAAIVQHLDVFPQGKETILPYYLIGGANQIETLRVPITADSKLKSPEFWEISYQTKWLREHKNAWKTAYGKSPFYLYYHYKIEAVLDLEITSYKQLHEQLIRLILPWIGLEELLENPKTPLEIEPMYQAYQEYYQVFETKFGHRKDLSIIDLIFHLGPESIHYFSRY